MFESTARSRRAAAHDNVAAREGMTGPGGAFGSEGLTGRDGTASLLHMLTRWLPRQRWFPGRGTSLADLGIVSDVILRAGDPALRHLIVEAALPSGPARFQVLVGYRREAAAASCAGAIIGHEHGVACYDALHDPELADVLLRGILRATPGRACCGSCASRPRRR